MLLVRKTKSPLTGFCEDEKTIEEALLWGEIISDFLGEPHANNAIKMLGKLLTILHDNGNLSQEEVLKIVGPEWKVKNESSAD